MPHGFGGSGGSSGSIPLIDVYRAEVRPLYAFVSRRVGGDRDLAEDVVQETFLRALAAWKRKGAPAAPAAWLRTAATNLIRNHYRALRPERLPVGFDLDAETLELASPDHAALVQWGLARLRDGHARLLEAYHLDGREVRAIAAEHGLSERAVEGRLRRARQALRALLARRIEGERA